eukprot:9068352-Pyramimonas_sp.AAC.1
MDSDRSVQYSLWSLLSTCMDSNRSVQYSTLQSLVIAEHLRGLGPVSTVQYSLWSLLSTCMDSDRSVQYSL